MNIKHLLKGVAIAAALVTAAPAWAQTSGGNTFGGNSIGLPGPNPGGPPVPSRYDGPGGAYHQAPPRPIPTSTSAMLPPPHHAVRHAKAMHVHHKTVARNAGLTGDTAAKLKPSRACPYPVGCPASTATLCADVRYANVS